MAIKNSDILVSFFDATNALATAIGEDDDDQQDGLFGAKSKKTQTQKSTMMHHKEQIMSARAAAANAAIKSTLRAIKKHLVQKIKKKLPMLMEKQKSCR